MSDLPLSYACLDLTLESRIGARRWWVAFSGGPDSTVLLHLMKSWCAAHPESAPTLMALHINHGMQRQANDWQSHCEGVCEQWNLPIVVSQVQVEPDGQGAEAAARKARYQVFEQELEDGDILFMGHHLDDQVETYFLRLLRGSGLSGLSAMPAQRSLGAGELVRPLIGISRSAIEAYAVEQGLSAIEDPSNSDTSIDRNYLRQTVLPLLAQRWGGYRQTVARAAQLAATSQQLLDESLPVPATVYSVMGDPGVEQSALLSSGGPGGAMIKLRKWLRLGGLLAPDKALMEEFIRQLIEGAPSSSPRLECGDYVLQRYQNNVYLLPEASPEPSLSPLTIGFDGLRHIPGVGELRIVPAQSDGLRLDPDDRLDIRWRNGGERCRPKGRPYNQRLKKLLQERAVPPWWRACVPLLYLHDELLAVGDLWLCESSRLTVREDHKGDLWQLCWDRKPSAFD